MPEYKFVDYKKLDPDKNYNEMLSEDYSDAPDSITDEQLKSSHVGVEEVTLEKQLEKARTGSASVVLEKNLNDAKDEFGSKHRNPSAYEGDINKLEEKRLANNPVEFEKYEDASVVPKRSRWWEVKSDDGLIIAFEKEKLTKEAQVLDEFVLKGLDTDKLDERDELEDEMLEEKHDLINEFEEFPITDAYGDFDINEVDQSDNFEIDDFENDDFQIDDVSPRLEEVSYKQEDIGGTPTAQGVIKVQSTKKKIKIARHEVNESLVSDLKKMMGEKHPDLPFDLRSFDFSRLDDEGIITYTIGVDEDLAFASTDFPIVTAVKKK